MHKQALCPPPPFHFSEVCIEEGSQKIVPSFAFFMMIIPLESKRDQFYADEEGKVQNRVTELSS